VHPIFGSRPVPRYVQLADILRERITRGQLVAGARLPTLDELVKEFDVARVTVRQAVDVLARDGLVSPQRGRGTFVTQRKAGTGGCTPSRRWASSRRSTATRNRNC